MVYLLHFERSYHHARHYLGYTSGDTVDFRLRQHGHSTPRLLEVIRGAGIGFVVARVWPEGDRELERALKRRKYGPRLCPICRGGNGGA